MSRDVKPPIVVVDTREQTPWIASIWREGRRVLLPVVRRALVAGDYTIEGYEAEIAIERKSLADWIGTMFGSSTDALGERATSWERFRREIQRAIVGVPDNDPPVLPLQRFLVIVEASREDVKAHRYRSQVLPQSVLGRSDSVFADHGVPVIWAGGEENGEGRKEAERLAMWTLVRWWEGRERMKGASAGDIAKAFRLVERGAAPDTRVPPGFEPVASQMGGNARERKATARRIHEGR